ncbi:uncharacterized protein LOC143850104 [Tasmannia lanceolata]|uniref:uncharacterized protein LOC143850104 n=1 Tax=Tasmannia lanceolata TaxID=3420 RepID=UPI004064A003
MPHSLSWGARSIFKNRYEFKVRICYLVGEGRDLNFWTDPWHPDGPVDSQTSIGTMLSNIPRNVSVHDIRSDSDWKEVLNSGPYGELTQIVHSGLFTKELPSYPLVPWYSSLWFPGHLPRHCPVVWQAIQSRLSTKDRLFFLGSQRDSTCSLCRSEPETHHHLFLACSYSSWVWRFILLRFGYRRKPNNGLQKEEEWLRKTFKGKGQIARAIRIAFSATVSHLWKERNRRVFEEKSTHKQQTLKDILDIIKFKTLYLKLQDIPSEKNIRISNILGLPCFSKEKSSRHCTWDPPPEDMAKLNSDASLANDQGSIGGLIRGSTSNIMVMFSWNKAPETISELELEAILEGVKLARSMDIRKLWIETDSMNALQIITGKCNCPWRKKVTLKLLQDLLTSFEMWKVSHQWREANQPADYLSKHDCPLKGIKILPTTA